MTTKKELKNFLGETRLEDLKIAADILENLNRGILAGSLRALRKFLAYLVRSDA